MKFPRHPLKYLLKEEALRKTIQVGSYRIFAEYLPGCGRLIVQVKSGRFSRRRDAGLTGIGAFTLTRALAEASEEESIRSLYYCVVGRTPREALLKDRLFSRVLTNLGYNPLGRLTNKELTRYRGRWYSPERHWTKNPLSSHPVQEEFD